jgi:hypothetical protein
MGTLNKQIYYISIAFLIIFQISDVLLTYYGIVSGYAEECNQIVNILIKIIGLLPTLILTKLAAFAIIYFIFLNNPKYTWDRLIPMIILVLVYVYVIINNLHICKFIGA